MPSTSPARLSAKPDSVLIVALSARSLALAAARAGYSAAVIDLFGDVDTRRLAERSLTVPGDLGQGFEAEALIEAARKLWPAKDESSGLVYGSGLESRPELLERLARGRRLWGNRPTVLRAIKDPAMFFDLLDRLSLPHPEVRTRPPAKMAGWLVKGIGGAGGGHVRLLAGASKTADQYYQRRVPGRPVSCLFLADGRNASLLGWSEQWPSPDPDHPFRFGGAVQPAGVPPAVAETIAAALPPLVKETGLVGLNSLDLMLDEAGGFHLLEVNPRPGASLDVFDGEGPQALFGRHVAACKGRLLSGWRPPKRASAMSVVYADRLLRVPRNISYPAWLADRPAPGARIELGAPVCTVMAAAANAEAARHLVLARGRRVLDALAAGAGGSLAEGAG
jgi:predicted ATP-grasp superfamily ATP-dependent carboligase